MASRSQADLFRLSKRFKGAIGAQSDHEPYLFGGPDGTLEDPADRTKFLCRKTEQSPTESFSWAGQGVLPALAGITVLVGWWAGERRIMGMDPRSMVAQNINYNRYNTADNRISTWWTVSGYPDLSTHAIGTMTNPSTLVTVFDGNWIDEEYILRTFKSQQVDLAPYIPGFGTHRLVLTAANPDNTVSVMASTAKGSGIDIVPADIQQCLDQLNPRSIPSQFWLLGYGQTKITNNDKFLDARFILNVPPPRNNYHATTPPTVSDDKTKGYTVGSEWVDTAAKVLWILFDDTPDAADWVQINGGSPSLAYWPRVLEDRVIDIETNNQIVTSTFKIEDGGMITSDGLITVVKGYVTINGTGEMILGPNGSFVVG